MNYLDEINKNLINSLNKEKNSLIFGQNINCGSFISGLTKNFDKQKRLKIYNTPNCEYSMIGSGFGFLISGGTAVYFAKQLDFMLLGCDHFVNTFNSIKNNNQINGKFKIVLFVCDQGFQGSQSSFNNIDDLSSLAQFDTYQINTKFEAETVTKYFFKKKGFAIYSVGQRLSKTEIFNKPFILYIGKRERYKNFVNFIKAFSNSQQLKNDFNVICFGGGPFTKNENDLFIKYKVSETVLKSKSDEDSYLYSLYKNAKCLVYPSLHEGLGLPPLEAMSLGCPVISSNHEAILEAVSDAASLFNPMEIVEITSVLVNTIYSNDKIKELKKNKNVNYIDFSNTIKEDSLFADLDHLNALGTNEFTKIFYDSIKIKYHEFIK